MRRTITASAVLVLMLPLGGCLALYNRTTTTVPEVERKIDQDLPIGSSRQEVEAWLTKQGIEFSFTDSPTSRKEGLVAPEDIDLYPTAISGIIFDASHSFLVTCNITLHFLFGPDGRLQKCVVGQIGTGL